MSTIASRPLIPTHTTATSARDRASLARSTLLACGIVAALLYVATDVIAAMRSPDYHYTSQTISELMAIDAPTRPFVVTLFLVHDVLLIAFAVGVWRSAPTRALRVTASLLVAIAAIGVAAAPWFPMHLRGVEGSLTDTMHIASTGAIVLCTFAAIGFASRAAGTWFRRYSIGTILMLFVAGGLTGLQGPRLAAQLPTPWMGITERIDAYGYLLWLAMLAIVLARTAPVRRPS
jgi:Protein of unknown function (DUF998)